MKFLNYLGGLRIYQKNIDSTKKLEETKYKPLIQNILVIKYKCNQNLRSIKKVLYYLRRLKKLESMSENSIKNIFKMVTGITPLSIKIL